MIGVFGLLDMMYYIRWCYAILYYIDSICFDIQTTWIINIDNEDTVIYKELRNHRV